MFIWLNIPRSVSGIGIQIVVCHTASKVGVAYSHKKRPSFDNVIPSVEHRHGTIVYLMPLMLAVLCDHTSLEYCSAVWSRHFKFLVFKIESVQRFFTKCLQGMWRQGYDDRLRLLNTHSLEYWRLYSDLVLCFQLPSNGFNSQLANVLIKSTDNRTRGHDFKLIKLTCSVDAMPLNITLQIR